MQWCGGRQNVYEISNSKISSSTPKFTVVLKHISREGVFNNATRNIRDTITCKNFDEKVFCSVQREIDNDCHHQQEPAGGRLAPHDSNYWSERQGSGNETLHRNAEYPNGGGDLHKGIQ